VIGKLSKADGCQHQLSRRGFTLKRFSPLLLGLLLFLVSCSSLQADTTYDGQWSIEFTDFRGGYGQGGMFLSQSGTQISGSWQVGTNVGSSSGSIQGSASGNNIALEFYSPNPVECPSSINAIRTGNTLEGTYSLFNCRIPGSGTFRASR
jgi:hypothetical protein